MVRPGESHQGLVERCRYSRALLVLHTGERRGGHIRSRLWHSDRAATARELKSGARDVKDSVTRQGEAKAEQGKRMVAGTASSAASALGDAAAGLREDSDAPDWLASGFSKAAKQIEDFAGRLENKSLRELAQETRRFARDNPTSFLAASAAVGFAAARFLRAGVEYDDSDDLQNGGFGGVGLSNRSAEASRSRPATVPPQTSSTGSVRDASPTVQSSLQASQTTGEIE